jgi:phosphotransferase system enzyme I (PtsP)
LLWQLDELFRVADFVSVGSNDLNAVHDGDRPRQQPAGRRFDPARPPSCTLYATWSAAPKRPASRCRSRRDCGRPLEALALAAIGFRSLSHGFRRDRPGQGALRSVEIAPVTVPAHDAARQGAPGAEIRADLRAWAEAHSVPI